MRVLQGGRHWEKLDAAIRSATRPFVAFTLPGVAPRPDWLREALVGLEGERVAVVTGAGLRAALPRPGPAALRRRRSDEPYPVLGLPSQYAVIRRTAYLELGGFDAATARLGSYAPLLELFERARLAGWLIGHRNTLGLSPPLGGRPGAPVGGVAALAGSGGADGTGRAHARTALAAPLRGRAASS